MVSPSALNEATISTDPAAAAWPDQWRTSGSGDGAASRAHAGSATPDAESTCACPCSRRRTSPLARVAVLFLGACAAFLGACALGLVLLVLGSTPAEAAPQSPVEPGPAVSDLLRPAQDLIGDDLSPFGDADVSAQLASLEPGRVIESLNGSGPLKGSTRLIDDTVGTAEGVLGATAGAPHTLLEAAGSATGPLQLAEADQLSLLAPATRPFDAVAQTGPPDHEAAPAHEPSGPAAGASAGWFGPYASGIQTQGTTLPPWLGPVHGFGAPTASSSGPVSGSRGPSAPLHGSLAKLPTPAGASADHAGGNHLQAGIVPDEDVPTPLALRFLANQPRRFLRSPVFPPLVPPG